MKQQRVTALVMDPQQNLRAAYVVTDDNGHAVERKDRIVGWAALGGRVVAMRVDKRLGRAVLVGTDDDPERERFFGVLVAGEQMSELGEDVDRRVRQMLRDELEVERDGEANED